MRILLVNNQFQAGGAESIVRNLWKGYQRQGHESWLAVRWKEYEEEGVFTISDRASSKGFLSRWFQNQSAGASRFLHRHCGWDDFYFPETKSLLAQSPGEPEILHGHNLHGEYFDLRLLPVFSKALPVFLTLHDSWWFEYHHGARGDCGACRRGKSNGLSRLREARNFFGDPVVINCRRRQRIFNKSRLFVAAPSRWLMEKAQSSILSPAIQESRIIPNGVDTQIFRPGSKLNARQALGLEKSAKILLFAANGIRKNPAKDFKTILAMMEKLSGRLESERVLLIAVGEKAESEKIGRAEIRFVPYVRDPHEMALFYQASDIYVHAARYEVWGLTITEALACGLPVVATHTGGIPEQISHGDNGFLAPQGDAEGLARHAEQLLRDEELRIKMGRRAAEQAGQFFSVDRMTHDYLNWFEEVLGSRNSGALSERSCDLIAEAAR